MCLNLFFLFQSTDKWSNYHRLSFWDTGAEGSSDLLLWPIRCLVSVCRPSICPEFFSILNFYSRTAGSILMKLGYFHINAIWHARLNDFSTRIFTIYYNKLCNMYKNAKLADFKFVHWFTAYYCKKNPYVSFHTFML